MDFAYVSKNIIPLADFANLSEPSLAFSFAVANDEIGKSPFEISILAHFYSARNSAELPSKTIVV